MPGNTTGVTPGLLKKGINDVFWKRYGKKTMGRIPSTEIFNIETKTIGMSETDVALASVSEFEATAEQKNINKDLVMERGQTLYQHELYTNGITVSYKQMLADETGSNTIKRASQLGKAAVESQEKKRFGVLRSGGSLLGLDGVALFSTVHPLADGSTQSNDISFNTNLYTTIKDMMSALRSQRQYQGDLSIAVDPKFLLCTEANYDAVIEVTEAVNIPNASDNNEVNFISKKFPGLRIGFQPYLGTAFGGDDKDLFMFAEKTDHHLKVMLREDINTWFKNWTEADNLDREFNAKYVESFGASDYLGTVRGQSEA